MCYVSQNLVSWYITVRTSCTTNPQQTAVMEFEHYVDRCIIHYVHPAMTQPLWLVTKLNRRQVLLTTSSTCRWKFRSPEFWTKFQRDNRIYGHSRISCVEHVAENLHAKTSSLSLIISVELWLVIGRHRQTDRQRYRVIAYTMLASGRKKTRKRCRRSIRRVDKMQRGFFLQQRKRNRRNVQMT